MSQLATEAEASHVDRSFLQWAWDNRSAAVHGTRVPFEADEQANHKFGLLQRLLQVTLRRAIEDPDFCEIFEDDDRISTAWPLQRAGGGSGP